MAENIQEPARQQRLFALKSTCKCAESGCTVCNYKLLLGSRASFDRLGVVPNERPQNCPREKRNAPLLQSLVSGSTAAFPASEVDGGIYAGLRQHLARPKCTLRVLTVGDGDLSFSLAIARLLMGVHTGNSKGSTKGSRVRCELYATSYESREDLLRIYPSSHRIVEELLTLGAHVLFNVDACDLCGSLESSAAASNVPFDTTAGFHRIIWNFPSIPIVPGLSESLENRKKQRRELVEATSPVQGGGPNLGYDGQVSELPQNQRMLQKFSAECTALLAPEGEVQITHKTKPPFHWWGIVDQMTLAETGASDQRTTHEHVISGGAALTYDGTVLFDRTCYPPYVNRKALDKKSFPCSDAVTYIFRRPLLFTTASKSPTTTVARVCPRTLPPDSGTKDHCEVDFVNRALRPVDHHLIQSIISRLRCAPRHGNFKKKTKNRSRKRRAPVGTAAAEQ
eukprot:INCI16175.1.p1 GENE.INCI16175.1~~INCI16175.1.p1  ORF type:complete len:453 (+),score=59.04 INCI16175.1:101-1459(+)